MSKYSEKKFFKSFKYALRGLAIAVKSQKNFLRQIMVAVAAIIIALFLKFEIIEFCIILILIAGVLICEMFNSVIEFMLDSVFKNKYSKLVEMSKDMAAGAVCIATSCAAAAGGLLFFHRIMIFIGR